MLINLKKYAISHKFLVITSIVLFLIPFFWFPFGYIDIGGDSSRLYFYDPLNFLLNFVLNPFLPDSVGIKSSGIHMLPFVSLLLFLKSLFNSSWFVNNLFNSISIVIPFFTLYEIVNIHLNDFIKTKYEKTNIYYASILTGLFFILIPISSQSGWDLPLIIHSQRFIYPLIFLLLFKYIHSSKSKYLLISLLLSFVFAHNFSWVSVPNVLGFFSIGILYLLIYAFFILKKSFLIKSLIMSFLVFILLQTFHLLPLASNLLSKNSDISNQLLHGSIYEDTVKYIDAIASYTEKGFHLFGLTPFSVFTGINFFLFIFPLSIAYMLLRNKDIRILYPTIFFLLTYFLVTAKITDMGFSFYKQLFLIPGMVSFRNFYGRWFDIYLLFYSIVIGLSMFFFLRSIPKITRYPFVFLVIFILVINSLPFITGQISNRILTKDIGVVVKSRVKVDPDVDKLLDWYRKEKSSERNITFPVADYTYQILAGANDDGAYFGPSMIAYLTGKSDLGSVFTLRPFTQVLFEKVKAGDFKTFANIFPLLGVKTVLYNSDKYIYEVFATFPYFESKEYMPKNQNGYSDFVKKLPLTKIKDFNNKYHLYSVNEQYSLPVLYMAENLIFYTQELKSTFDESNYNNAKFVLENFCCNKHTSLKNAFLNKNVKINDISQPKITYKKLEHSKYSLKIENVNKPYLLVFSQAFHPSWKIFKAEDASSLFKLYKPIADDRHYLVNVYANGWYIKPSDLNNKQNYTLILEMVDNRLTFAGLAISICGLIILFIWSIKIIWIKQKYY